MISWEKCFFKVKAFVFFAVVFFEAFMIPVPVRRLHIVMEEVITGTCWEMCPAEERALREREGLLHRLEAQNPKDNIRVAKADILRTIKSFSRSAAGQTSATSETLRPGPVLLRTVNYLMQEITPVDDGRPIDVYEFICDRLRAVRQDMTIQRLAPDVSISLLEPMVRFHVFFGYKLASHEKFDAALNDAQLFECLNRLISLYDHCESYPVPSYPEIRDIFTCINLGRPEFVVKRLQFSTICLSLELISAWAVQNFERIMKLVERLPLLARMALARQIPEIRWHAFRALCHAYSSNNASYDINVIALSLLYNSAGDAEKDCKRLGIRCENGIVKFHKKDFLACNKLLPLTDWWAVECLKDNYKLGSLLMGRYS